MLGVSGASGALGASGAREEIYQLRYTSVLRDLPKNIALREAGTGNGERGTVDSQIVSGFINVLTNLRSAIRYQLANNLL